uniref:Uncharacterized protein n=1 Tax=Arundo donax TaxID=35708 RepID=A0A0A9ACV2_ARUDO
MGLTFAPLLGHCRRSRTMRLCFCCFSMFSLMCFTVHKSDPSLFFLRNDSSLIHVSFLCFTIDNL